MFVHLKQIFSIDYILNILFIYLNFDITKVMLLNIKNINKMFKFH